MSKEQRNHPKMGQKLSIKTGPLKGRFVEVINYLTTQYQGKDIKRIKEDRFIAAVRNRGLPVDDDVVFVRFFPGMEYGCVHDSELKVPPAPENVESINKNKRKKKDDANQKPA